MSLQFSIISIQSCKQFANILKVFSIILLPPKFYYLQDFHLTKPIQNCSAPQLPVTVM